MNIMHSYFISSKSLSSLIFILIIYALFTGCKSKIDEFYELKELGLTEQAEQQMIELVNEDPLNAEAYFALGNLYSETGRLRDAVKNFNNAINIDQDNQQYKLRLLFLKLLPTIYKTQGGNSEKISVYEDDINASLTLNPSNHIPYMLLCRLYFSNISYDSSFIKKYFSSLSRLIELKPLEDWRQLYSNIGKRKISAEVFRIKTDSLKYFDKTNNEEKYLVKSSIPGIHKVENDTIFFKDYNNYSLMPNYAWKIRNVKEVGTAKEIYIRENFKNQLYTEPKSAYTNTSFDGKRSSNFKYGWTRNWIYSNIVSSLREKTEYTGKTSKYIMQIMNNSGRWISYEYNWMQVKYYTRDYAACQTPISENIIIFSNHQSHSLYERKDQLHLEEEIVYNIFQAGYIAKNMSVDLVDWSLNLKPYKIQYNRDNIKEFYSYGDYTLVFEDGILSDIKNIKNTPSN